MPAAKVKAPRVARTRNAGTMTEAGFRGWIRSQLRRMSQRWRPIYATLHDGRRAPTATERLSFGNRIKWVNNCQECQKYFPLKDLEVDHIIPCGSLIDIERDAGPFIMRLLCEMDGLRRLCHPCHVSITNGETE